MLLLDQGPLHCVYKSKVFYFNERSFLLQSVMFLLLVILSPTLLLINAKTFVVKTRNSRRQTFESPIALNSISLDEEDVSHNYSLKLSSPSGTRKRLRNFSVRLHHDKLEEEETIEYISFIQHCVFLASRVALYLHV